MIFIYLTKKCLLFNELFWLFCSPKSSLYFLFDHTLGGPQIRFSIGAGDRQALQPSLSATIPVTGTCVYELFENLGIESVVTLVCSAMTEHKILLYSRSYSRLNDACHALTSIMYPFVYNHIYIPLLPSPLIEVLSTPTPFIMGIHSSLKNEADLVSKLQVFYHE